MKNSKITWKYFAAGVLLSAVLTFPATSWAAMDMFLNIAGIEGESVDQIHRGEHEVLAYSFGISHPAALDGSRTRPEFQDLSVTKWLNKGSPTLRLYCANGTHIDEVTLTLRKITGAGPIDFWKIKLTDVILTSVNSGASGGEERPVENVTFNYGKIEWSYTETGADGKAGGTINSGWDIIVNKGL